MDRGPPWGCTVIATWPRACGRPENSNNLAVARAFLSSASFLVLCNKLNVYSFTTFLIIFSAIIHFLNKWARLRPGRSGVRIPEESRDLLFFEACKLALGPAQSLIPRVKGKGKGKVRPITGYEVPEVEWRYSSSLSLTSALDRSGWSKPHPGALFRERPGTL